MLFRSVGDFYEIFGKDAVTASEILGITLTRRANGRDNYIELAGFPHHALDTYLPKLVRAGKRGAICEQLEDPMCSLLWRCVFILLQDSASREADSEAQMTAMLLFR